jgi:hypothetical protein
MAGSDKATDDFFYSLVNQHARKQSWPVTDPADIIDFYTVDEPWLHDRAQTFYNGYIRTGNPDMLREANWATDHYAEHLRAGELRRDLLPVLRRQLQAQEPDRPCRIRTWKSYSENSCPTTCSTATPPAAEDRYIRGWSSTST